MALTDKSFSEFSSANGISENDLLLTSIANTENYETRKVTARAIANSLNNVMPMASLDTTGKTVVGAINELNTNKISTSAFSYDATTSTLTITI